MSLMVRGSSLVSSSIVYVRESQIRKTVDPHMEQIRCNVVVQRGTNSPSLIMVQRPCQVVSRSLEVPGGTTGFVLQDSSLEDARRRSARVRSLCRWAALSRLPHTGLSLLPRSRSAQTAIACEERSFATCSFHAPMHLSCFLPRTSAPPPPALAASVLHAGRCCKVIQHARLFHARCCKVI